MRSVRKWGTRTIGTIGSFRPPLAAFWSEQNGDLASRDLVGRSAKSLRWANAPGNVPLSGRLTGLEKDSVANVSQIVTLDRDLLADRVGKLARAKLELILAGIDVILGR